MISNMLFDRIIKMIENYLQNHSQEIQQFLLTQISVMSKKMIEYVDEKVKEFTDEQ